MWFNFFISLPLPPSLFVPPPHPPPSVSLSLTALQTWISWKARKVAHLDMDISTDVARRASVFEQELAL